MATDLIPDVGEEIIQTLNRIDVGIQTLKEKLAEKDKRILELEEKLREKSKDGS